MIESYRSEPHVFSFESPCAFTRKLFFDCCVLLRIKEKNLEATRISLVSFGSLMEKESQRKLMDSFCELLGIKQDKKVNSFSVDFEKEAELLKQYEIEVGEVLSEEQMRAIYE